MFNKFSRKFRISIPVSLTLGYYFPFYNLIDTIISSFHKMVRQIQVFGHFVETRYYRVEIIRE